MFASATIKKSNCMLRVSSEENAISLQDNSMGTSLPLMLNQAAVSIVHGDCSAAREILKGIIADNMDNPEIYNLFGISFERDGDRLKASKFYRVSYYMDQTFKPAAENLSRIGMFQYKQGIDSIAWGIEMREVQK